MVEVGYIPTLDTSFAMAFNSYTAMNSSMTLQVAGEDVRHETQFCKALDLVLRAFVPGFPALRCPQCTNNWNCPG